MALKQVTYTPPSNYIAKIRRVGVREDREAAYGVTRSVAVFSADLGGSSNYSSENLEGRSGERFHENSS